MGVNWCDKTLALKMHVDHSVEFAGFGVCQRQRHKPRKEFGSLVGGAKPGIGTEPSLVC